MVQNKDKIEKAKQIAQQKIGFIRHFFIYAVVMIVLVIINNITSPAYQWWLWPALGWGIGVSLHFLSVFILRGSSLEKRLIQKELERMKDEE